MLNFKKIFAVALCAVNFVCTISFGNSDVYAENETPAIWDGTYDTSWYDSQEKELHIKTAEGLAGLAHLVNTGHTMEGQIIHLDNDVYLNDMSDYENWEEKAPANNWVAIGSKYDTPFMGTFDGNSNTIYGLYMYHFHLYDVIFDINNEASIHSLSGFIGYLNSGVIKNCVFDNSYVYSNNEFWQPCNYAYSSIVCGLSNCGIISNIITKNGTLKSFLQLNPDGFSAETLEQFDGIVQHSFSGGICGKCINGTIKECKNECEIIDLIVERFQNSYGGICGYSEKESIIEKCINSGEIYYTDLKEVPYGHIPEYYGFYGGIVGKMRDNCSISDCYNSGMITSYDGYSGGIVGKDISKDNKSDCIIKNCYNIGKLKYLDSFGFTGAISGEAMNIENSYYLSGTHTNGVGSGTDTIVSKNSDNMKKESFAELLGDAYTYVEGDYPKLLWEVSKSIIYGDINNDNEVSIADLVMLQKYMTGTGELTNTQTADICCDGEINVFDVVSLRRMLIEKM